MPALRGRRYWLVGASEGLGAALAASLLRAGARPVLSARRAGRLEEVVRRIGGGECVPMDVRDGASVAAAADRVGPVDGMVYLAGLYWPMRAQEWDEEQVLAMADVNFLGALRLVGAVLPGMVARDSGHLVFAGSLAAFRGLPGAQGYGASKAGLMGLAESLRADLRRSSVCVQLVSPGFIRTRLTDKNDFRMPAIMAPEEAAERVVAHMRTGRFHRAFPAPFSTLFRVSRLLPEALHARFFS